MTAIDAIDDWLQTMRERCEKATPGPWYVGAMNDALFVINEPPRPAPVDYHNDTLHTKIVATPNEPHHGDWTLCEYVGNSDFIAHARTDLPACIAALEIAIKRLRMSAATCADDRQAIAVIERTLKGAQ